MSDKSIEDLAHMINPVVRGWINYYGSYYKSALYPIYEQLNNALKKWADAEIQKAAWKETARQYIGWAGSHGVNLVYLPIGRRCAQSLRLVDRSRMNREVHVRICEGLRGRVPFVLLDPDLRSK